MSKLKTISKITALIAFISLGVWGVKYMTAPAYEGNVGIRYSKAFAPARNSNIDFHIWYPANPGGRNVIVGGNGVFYGTSAGRGASHKNGKFPLILMSHGAGGNAGQFGWIASALARAGYVVVLPNHPGTTSGNASALAAVRVWERPADISAVIDEIIANPQAYPYINTNRIAALGFSAGGYTALAVSGARVDVEALQSFCDHGDNGMSDCAFLARGDIDLHSLDLSQASQDLRDPRIKVAVIIDPGIIETLTPISLSKVDIPMLILNLGKIDTIPKGVYARSAAEAMPKAKYQIIDDAIHFSFMAQCKPKGAAILADEGEPDPLCDDAGGRERSLIHKELEQLIVRFLNDAEW